MAYRISRRAEDDLTELYRAGVELFGQDQAERYFSGIGQAIDFLTEYPRAARERLEIKPPVRIHRHKAHMIVYRIDGADILILRVRHSREDWISQPA